MKYSEAIKVVKEKGCLVAALNHKQKELFIIEYVNDPVLFSDLIIWYSKDEGASAGVEGSYSPDEIIEEFPFIKQLDFFMIRKEGLDALSLVWEYATHTINENIIT
jgi:hypothetical protein